MRAFDRLSVIFSSAFNPPRWHHTSEQTSIKEKSHHPPHPRLEFALSTNSTQPWTDSLLNKTFISSSQRSKPSSPSPLALANLHLTLNISLTAQQVIVLLIHITYISESNLDPAIDGQPVEQNFHFLFPAIKVFSPSTAYACDVTSATKRSSNGGTMGALSIQSESLHHVFQIRGNVEIERAT